MDPDALTRNNRSALLPFSALSRLDYNYNARATGPSHLSLHNKLLILRNERLLAKHLILTARTGPPCNQKGGSQLSVLSPLFTHEHQAPTAILLPAVFLCTCGISVFHCPPPKQGYSLSESLLPKTRILSAQSPAVQNFYFSRCRPPFAQRGHLTHVVRMPRPPLMLK